MATNEITLLQKYKPKDWTELILPVRIKNELFKIQEKKGYRVLLYSSPGTGKTSTATLLCAGPDYENMYLSGSNNFTADVMRNKVMSFASGFSVMGKKKVIIIDEAENIKDNLQDAFKIILDQCVSVSFIFITNEVDKMNEAILSRSTQIEYDFNGDDMTEHRNNYIKFAIRVAKAEGIQYEAAGMSALYQMNFPDFRHLLVNLQSLKDSGETLTEAVVARFSENGKTNQELYDIIENPAITGEIFYNKLSTMRGKEKDCFLSLGEPFFLYLNAKNLHGKTLDCAMIVCKYSDMYVTSISKFTTFLSCIVELKTLFR